LLGDVGTDVEHEDLFSDIVMFEWLYFSDGENDAIISNKSYLILTDFRIN